MATIVSTWGKADAFVRSALMGLGATQQDPNGRYYLDGNMVNVELSQVIAETIYIEEMFRDGQSITSKYTTDRQAGAVRIMLDTPFDMTSRTISYGGRKGTPNNGGVINVNPPLLPTNDEFMVYLNQVNDQSMLFADLAKEMIPLDVMAKKIASYAQSVVQDRSASTLAEILAYNFMRSLNGGDNLNPIADLTAEGAYGDMLNTLNSKLDNGDRAASAFTFSTEGRTIIGRPSFVNGAFNRKSGVILLGGDLSQEMLRSYDLDVNRSDRDYVGMNYKGKAMQFHWQSAPDYIWYLAELYLGLPQGALSHVSAIAVSYEATAGGYINDLGVKIIDANEVRGVKAQPLNKWGHEAFRKSQIIGDGSLTTDYVSTTLGFTADGRVYPVAPNKLHNRDKATVPVYGEDGTVIGYKVIAEGIKPNGGNWQTGLPQVQAVTASPTAGAYTGTQTVKLTTTTTGATIFYTIDGTTPTSSSTKYTAAISVTDTEIVKAIAIKAGEVPSPVLIAEYVISTVSK